MNEDFTDITEPKLLFDFGTAAIDGDIVYNPKAKEYVLFFKDGPLGHEQKIPHAARRNACHCTPTGPYTIEWRHLQKEGQYPVEGSSVFSLIGSDEYIPNVRLLRTGFLPILQEHEPERLHIRAKHEDPATSPRATAPSCTSHQAERERLEAWSS